VPAQRSEFHPSSIKDILHSWAISAIDEWFAREQTDLRLYAVDPAARRRTNTQLVIDQDGFKPRAQGLFWDLRVAMSQLMRRDAPGVISLNADAVRAAAGPAYPDQELLDGIQHGVRMPAAHQLCVMLLPNLISIGGAGTLQHHADVTRMEAVRILSVHTSELSRFLLTLLHDDRIHVASERVLGFGCAPSSGIAQRFAHLVREVVTARMIVADEEAMAELRARTGPHMRTWFARRDALTARTGRPQPLLFAISIYTNDLAQNAVGCVRMVVFVIAWTDTCDELGIICADPHKRGLGTFILCLGIILCHTFWGAFVPVSKVLRASADIVVVLSRE
jgi:hypothetical protein